MGLNLTCCVILTGLGGRFGSTPGLFVGIGFLKQISKIYKVKDQMSDDTTYRQPLRFIVDFNDHIRWEIIVLFAGRFQQTKAQLHLLDVIAFDPRTYVSRTGYIGGLLWG